MRQNKIRGKHLRLTEKTNALDYLEKAYLFISQTEADFLAWKWVVIALHGALYGFAICACAGSNPYAVMMKKRRPIDTVNVIEDSIVETVKGELIDFNKALERCQNSRWTRKYVHSKPLELTSSQNESIKYLHKIRNNFQHFIPKGWSLKRHCMPQICIDLLDVIHYLALDTGNVRLTQTQKKKVKYIVFRSNRILKQSELYKNVKLYGEYGEQQLKSKSSMSAAFAKIFEF